MPVLTHATFEIFETQMVVYFYESMRIIFSNNDMQKRMGITQCLKAFGFLFKKSKIHFLTLEESIMLLVLFPCETKIFGHFVVVSAMQRTEENVLYENWN